MANFLYPLYHRSLFVVVLCALGLFGGVTALTPTTALSFYNEGGEPLLELNNTADSAVTYPGAELVYTLHYTVTAADATNVVITELVPEYTTANLQSDAITPGWVCPQGTDAGKTCTLNLADTAVTADSSGAVQFVVNVIAAPIPAGVEVIENTAEIASGGTTNNLVTTNNSTVASVVVALDATPDLTITKSAGDGTPKPGEELSYSLTVVNNGNQVATGVQLTEIIPAHTSYLPSSNPAGWLCPDGNAAGQTCQLALGDLEPGSLQNFSFVVQLASAVPLAVTYLENTATVTDDGQGGSDPTDDNSATVQTPIDVLPVLTLRKTDNDLVVLAGEWITYTLTVENSGAQSAQNVVITETVPPATQFVGPAELWDCAPGAVAGTICVHTLATVTLQQPTSVQFIVQVLDPVPDGIIAIENTALLCGDYWPEISATAVTPLTTPPDLALSTTASPNPANPGAGIVYTMVYSNQGGRSAPNSQIITVIPENTHFWADESSAGWLCTPNHDAPSTCRLTIGTVDAGMSDSVRWAVQVDPFLASGVTAIENLATISHDDSQGNEPTPDDNQSQLSVSVNAAPDLQVTKSDGGITATAGQTVIYDLVYANVGNQTATNVVLEETVPAHSTYNANESQSAWSCSDGGGAGAHCTLALGTVAGNQQGTVSFAVNIDNQLPALLTPLINHAQLSDDGNNGADLRPEDNVATDTTPLKAAPSLRIATDDQASQVAPSAQITYRLAYTNAGNQAAQGVIISSTVPAYTVFVGPTEQWDCPAAAPAGTLCTTTVGTVAAQSQGTINFIVQIDDPLPSDVNEVRHLVQIGNGVEPQAYEDQAGTPVIAAPELRLNKSDGGATVEPGQTVVYILTYENRGNQAATGVWLREEIPAHTTFVADLSSAGWVCLESSCTYPVGDLAGGASGQVEFAVQINSFLRAFITKVDNLAQIADDQRNGADPIPANNQAADSTDVGISLALHATMQAQLVGDADGNQRVSPGDTLEYLVEIYNRGNRELTEITFTDSLDQYTKMAASGAIQTSQGSVLTGNRAQDQNIQVQIGDLRPNTKATITFRVVINKPLPANAILIEQQGTVTSNEVPLVSTDDPTVAGANDRTKTAVLLEPLLRISKQDFLFEDADNNEKVSSGDKILYSIRVTNIGNAATAAIVLTDTIDANTTLLIGKVQSSRGAIVSGNRNGDTDVKVEIGMLAGGESTEINFLVVLKPTLTGTQLINQAVATYARVEQIVSAVSDDPATAQAPDATVTPINRAIAELLLRLYLPLVRKGQ